MFSTGATRKEPRSAGGLRVSGERHARGVLRITDVVRSLPASSWRDSSHLPPLQSGTSAAPSGPRSCLGEGPAVGGADARHRDPLQRSVPPCRIGRGAACVATASPDKSGFDFRPLFHLTPQPLRRLGSIYAAFGKSRSMGTGPRPGGASASMKLAPAVERHRPWQPPGRPGGCSGAAASLSTPRGL